MTVGNKKARLPEALDKITVKISSGFSIGLFDWVRYFSGLMSPAMILIPKLLRAFKAWTDARRPVPRLWSRSAEVRGGGGGRL